MGKDVRRVRQVGQVGQVRRVGQVGRVRQVGRVGQVRRVGVVKGSRVFGNEVMTFFLFFSVKKIISFV